MKRLKSKNRYHGRSLIADITAHLNSAVKKVAKNVAKKKSCTADTTNNRLQHKYIRYLRDAKGRSEGTILKAEDALRRWFEFTKDRSLVSALNDQIIIDFKASLRKPRSNGRPLSPGTRFDILLQVKGFLEWLSEQPGFRARIKKHDLDYLNPNSEERQYRQQRKPKRYPTLQQVERLISSIPTVTILLRRDRALIALLIASGIRIDAAVSLSIGSFDAAKMAIEQDPRDGVRTKFCKYIRTVLIPVTQELFSILRDWYNELIDLGFGYQDPLFPCALPKLDGIAYVQSDELSRDFISASQMRALIKEHCIKASLPSFNPHSFRHANAAIGLERAKTARDIKALSLNMGHESAKLIIDTYGYMSEREIEEIIQSLKEEE